MVNLAKLTKKRLGELLLEEGLITDKQLNDALQEQKKTGELLGAILVRLKFIEEEDIVRAISRQFGLPPINPCLYGITNEIVEIVPIETMLKYHFVPLDKIGNILILACASLLDAETCMQIEKKANCLVSIYISSPTRVLEAIKKLQTGKVPTKKIKKI